MIKKYTIVISQLGVEAGLSRCEEVVCNILSDNGQGVVLQDNGALLITRDNLDCVAYAPGTWVKVFSE